MCSDFVRLKSARLRDRTFFVQSVDKKSEPGKICVKPFHTDVTRTNFRAARMFEFEIRNIYQC